MKSHYNTNGIKKSPPKRVFYFSTPIYSNSSGEIDTVGLSGICTDGSGICTVGVFPPPPPHADNANAIAIIKITRFISLQLTEFAILWRKKLLLRLLPSSILLPLTICCFLFFVNSPLCKLFAVFVLWEFLRFRCESFAGIRR